MTSGAIAGLVSRGTLERLERGVYRVAGSARPPEQPVVAALLRARPAARASGPFVLGILGVEGFTRSDPFLVVTRTGRTPTGVTFLHRVGHHWEGRVRLAGILCCDPAAVLVEVAAPRWGIEDRRLRIAADQLRWRSRLTTRGLLGTIEQAAATTHPGARRLASLGRQGLVPESEGERRLASVLRGIEPEPTPQVWFGDRFRVDLAWPELGLAVEYDGRVDHRSDRSASRCTP